MSPPHLALCWAALGLHWALSLVNYSLHHLSKKKLSLSCGQTKHVSSTHRSGHEGPHAQKAVHIKTYGKFNLENIWLLLLPRKPMHSTDPVRPMTLNTHQHANTTQAPGTFLLISCPRSPNQRQLHPNANQPCGLCCFAQWRQTLLWRVDRSGRSKCLRSKVRGEGNQLL